MLKYVKILKSVSRFPRGLTLLSRMAFWYSNRMGFMMPRMVSEGPGTLDANQDALVHRSPEMMSGWGFSWSDELGGFWAVLSWSRIIFKKLNKHGEERANTPWIPIDIHMIWLYLSYGSKANMSTSMQPINISMSLKLQYMPQISPKIKYTCNSSTYYHH